MIPGIVASAVGAILLSPPMYRFKSVNWNSPFVYIFIVIGFFLLIVGVRSVLRAWNYVGSKQGPMIDAMSTDQPPGGVAVCVDIDNSPTELNIAQYKNAHKRSDYYKFAMGVGLLPSLPLALFIVVSSTCSIFGLGSGVDNICTREEFAYFGVLGWVLSLPAWGLLVLAGKLLGIR